MTWHVELCKSDTVETTMMVLFQKLYRPQEVVLFKLICTFFAIIYCNCGRGWLLLAPRSLVFTDLRAWSSGISRHYRCMWRIRLAILFTNPTPIQINSEFLFIFIIIVVVEGFYMLRAAWFELISGPTVVAFRCRLAIAAAWGAHGCRLFSTNTTPALNSTISWFFCWLRPLRWC